MQCIIIIIKERSKMQRIWFPPLHQIINKCVLLKITKLYSHIILMGNGTTALINLISTKFNSNA